MIESVADDVEIHASNVILYRGGLIENVVERLVFFLNGTPSHIYLNGEKLQVSRAFSVSGNGQIVLVPDTFVACY